MDATSAEQICRQLGYINGKVETIVNSNTCPEPHYNDTIGKWESDLINTPGFGKSYACSGACISKFWHFIPLTLSIIYA